MATRATGQPTKILLGKEATPGVLPGTPAAFRLPVFQPNFPFERPTFQSEALTGFPEPRTVHLGKKNAAWDFGLECSHASMLPVLELVLGGKRRQGLGFPYAYEFYLADLVTWFVEEQLDTGENVVTGYLMGGNFDFTVGPEGEMSARVSGLAAIQTQSGSAAVAAPNITDLAGGFPSFSYLLSRTKVNGTKIGNNKTFQCSVSRNLGRDIEQDETELTAVIFPQIPTVGGNLTSNWADSTMYDHAVSAALKSLESWVPGGNGLGLLVEILAAKFSGVRKEYEGSGLIRTSGRYDAQGPSADHPGRAYSGFFETSDLDTETLVVSVDGGGDQTVTFAADGMTPEAVKTAIEAQTTGCTVTIHREAGEDGALIALESDTVGASSSIEVKAASTADVLLGFDNVAHSGLDDKSLLITVFSTVDYS